MPRKKQLLTPEQQAQKKEAYREAFFAKTGRRTKSISAYAESFDMLARCGEYGYSNQADMLRDALQCLENQKSPAAPGQP